MFVVVVEGIKTCKTGHIVNKPECLCLCCFIEYVHTRDWRFWKMSFSVHDFVVVEGMYICKTDNFGKEDSCLFLVFVEGMYTCRDGMYS